MTRWLMDATSADLFLALAVTWSVCWVLGLSVYAFWPYRTLKRFQRDMQRLYRQHQREQREVTR